MNTQIEIKLFAICNFMDVAILPELVPANPNSASSLDYGFDFDANELAQGLSASLPVNIAPESLPVIAAEEFDALYKWFIS